MEYTKVFWAKPSSVMQRTALPAYGQTDFG
jgi:hypothetical protein